MRRSFVPYLRCPETGKPLKLTVFATSGDHISAGLLRTGTTWYPIIDGIPRLLIGTLKTHLLQIHYKFLIKHRLKLPSAIRKEWQKIIDAVPSFDAFLAHQRRTAESFAYEWKHIYKENDFEKQNFYHFLSPFVREEDVAGKVTVDIGCGSGRFTKWAALAGTKVSFGSDLGESVAVAYDMTKDQENTCIVQADIYDMPFNGSFDLAYSIGVLHHLPEPQKGFARLPAVLKVGGKMLIWVYNRRGNARALYFYEPLRAIARVVPPRLLYRLCFIPASIVQLFNYVTVGLQRIGLPGLAKKVPFSYYANFPFNMKLNDSFDVLATPKSNYYLKEEVEKWFTKSRLKQVKSYEHPEAGITAIGIRS